MERRIQPAVQGILLVDKPIDWTSHDVVNFIRRRFNIKKAGHGGTLDPIATGLLVLFVGQATRYVQSFEHDDKEYIATMAFGCETFSNDGTGEVISKHSLEYIPLAEIHKVFAEFVGDIMQAPPQVSAVKINGKRLYKLALNGQTVTAEPRPRTIHALEILHYSFPYVMFKMVCSKGTYVRKLCSDIGARLGCGGYMSSLIRTRSGDFGLGGAVTIEQLRSIGRDDLKSYLISPSSVEAINQKRLAQ
ncbi:MAG: tRNA pseudouridine(55) synthase TruB [Candidatus Auribacterota bacterium]|jgi:tRNA pseudouridine55 synthase|nr:tRNA pseudouridine(55) synthase TruB [Candidatus Auribacterota bacterium]